MIKWPDDIQAEVLLDVWSEKVVHVSLKGLHKRNACRDISEAFSLGSDGKITLSLTRMSLYDALPEYLFHPFDRYNFLEGKAFKERFEEEHDKQEHETEHALSFFAPIDLSLLHLRKDVYRRMNQHAARNRVLENILSDRLTKEQRCNRFIQKTLPFLPDARNIRGDRTCLTWMLRKVLKEESLNVEVSEIDFLLEDAAPRYEDRLGTGLDRLFVGNQFAETIRCYRIRYWPEDECNDLFLQFVDEMEMYRVFVRDYFLSVEEDIAFEIVDETSPVDLAGPESLSFLDYNTNI